MILGQSYILKGQLSEGLAECQKARELDDDPQVLAYVAFAQAALGKKEEAAKVLAQMNELARKRYVPSYAFAVVYIGLGDKDQAFHWLERSLEERAWEITYLKVEPFMDTLHSDPRFADLVRPDGDLVLAGLLEQEVSDVTHAYDAWFDIRPFGQREGWVGLCGRRRHCSSG